MAVRVARPVRCRALVSGQYPVDRGAGIAFGRASAASERQHDAQPACTEKESQGSLLPFSECW
jgi:hypothetical protein